MLTPAVAAANHDGLAEGIFFALVVLGVSCFVVGTLFVWGVSALVMLRREPRSAERQRRVRLFGWLHALLGLGGLAGCVLAGPAHDDRWKLYPLSALVMGLGILLLYTEQSLTAKPTPKR